MAVEGDCRLQVDLRASAAPLEVGDWVATVAGSRYVIVGLRRMRRRRVAAMVRYGLKCRRMGHGVVPPVGVRVVWLTWCRRSGGRVEDV